MGNVGRGRGTHGRGGGNEWGTWGGEREHGLRKVGR
jgi:hypothetical protein